MDKTAAERIAEQIQTIIARVKSDIADGREKSLAITKLDEATLWLTRTEVKLESLIRDTDGSWSVVKNGVVLAHTFNEEEARHAYKISVSANYGRPFTLIELWHNGDVVKHNGDV